MVNISDKAGKARRLVAELSKDFDKVLGMVEFSVPAGEGVAKRVIERMDEIKKLFGVSQDGKDD